MNAYTSQEELALIPANRISYAEHYAPKAQSSQGVFARVGEFFRRQAALREMSNLTDRELTDIGLARSDLAHVFDQDFSARRSR